MRSVFGSHGSRIAFAWAVAAFASRACASGDPESTPLGAPVESLPIGAPGGGGSDAFSLAGYLQTLFALALVLGLMLVLAAAFKRFARARGGLAGGLGPGGPSPSGVLEILGRYPLGGGRSLVLLRFDRRVLLMHQSSGRKNAGMTTLSEVTDAEEVASIMMKTRQPEDERAQGSFREAIRRMERGFEEANPERNDDDSPQRQLDLLVSDTGTQPASAIRSRLRAWTGVS